MSAEKQIKELAASGELPPLLLVLCPDDIRLERALGYLLSSLEKKRGESLEKKTLDLRSASIADIRGLHDSAAALSLFSTFSVQLVRGVDACSTPNLRELTEILKSAAGDPITVTGKKLAKNSALYKYAKKQKTLIEFPVLEKNSLSSWTAKELKRAGIERPSDKLAETIAQIGEGNLDIIHNIATQLGLYSADGTLEVEDVFKVFVDVPDPNEYGLTEAVASGNPGRAELLLHELIQTGKNPFLLLSRLSYDFATLSKINSLRAKGLGDGEICSTLGMRDWLFRKHAQTARKYTPGKLKECTRAIAFADSQLKNKSTGEASIISELLYKLAA